jgi:hypothetical protein
MTTIAAVVVCLEEDDPSATLDTLRFADEIHVLTDRASAVDRLAARGCVAHVIPRPLYIENVGRQLLAIGSSEWILLVDPDERVSVDEPGLRRALASARQDVAALDIRFTVSLFGGDLATTFVDLTKTKLLRAGRCSWSDEIHALPHPTDAHDRIESLDAGIITVASELAEDLSQRLARHAYWASVEARDRERPVDVDRFLDAMVDPLAEYLDDRRGVEDGITGLANALLHVAKEIQRSLFEASQLGLEEMSAADRHRVESLVAAMRDA